MKKLLSLLLAFAMCLSLASCAKTPDAPVVMQKDQEQLVEMKLSISVDRKKSDSTKLKLPQQENRNSASS